MSTSAVAVNENGVTPRERALMKAMLAQIDAEMAPLRKAAAEVQALRAEVEALRAETAGYRAAFGLVPMPDMRSALTGPAPTSPRRARA